MRINFDSSRSLATTDTLRKRSELMKLVRRFFDERGFIEVHTPVLGSEFVIDRHIDPIELSMRDPITKEASHWFLQSSPEAAMKRLMAGGMDRIYSLGPVFRQGEFGDRHNPEFTMLEWYRCGDDLESACQLLNDLICMALGREQAMKVTFADAFQQATDLSLFDCRLGDLQLVSERFNLGVSQKYSDDWDDWVNLIFSELIQPRCGKIQPTLITHFPATQAALARLDPNDSQVAERFEIFVDGLELANGYCELLDVEIFRNRCEIENRLRIKDGKSALPLPQKLIAAMEVGLPAMSGCALGFDRLAMLYCKKPTIAEVLAFANDRV